MTGTEDVITRYYGAFNAGDYGGMLALMAEDVVHDINQGGREVGRAAFSAFLKHMERCYRENLTDIIIFQSPCGTRAAAEFVVHGEYLLTDEPLPPARGQRYVLPAGAFFELRDGMILRVSNYYNLQAWLDQIAA